MKQAFYSAEHCMISIAILLPLLGPIFIDRNIWATVNSQATGKIRIKHEMFGVKDQMEKL